MNKNRSKKKKQTWIRLFGALEKISIHFKINYYLKHLIYLIKKKMGKKEGKEKEEVVDSFLFIFLGKYTHL